MVPGKSRRKRSFALPYHISDRGDILLSDYSRCDAGAFTSASAANRLLNGEAQAYRAQEQERVAILEDTSIENAELKEFQNKPYLLFYEDLEGGYDNWKNVRMRSYYRKNSVILIESETE